MLGAINLIEYTISRFEMSIFPKREPANFATTEPEVLNVASKKTMNVALDHLRF